MSSLNKRRTSYPESSLTLALSAAEGRLVMALGRQDENGVELLFGQDWQATAQGVELLTPALDFALRALKLTPRHIERIAAVSGPGSFTGLRLSIITASGLARGLKAQQAGLPYLPLLAKYAATVLAEFATAENPAELWAITYARRGLVYAQGFKLQTGGLTELSQILVLGLEEAASLLAGRPILAFGSGVSKNFDFFRAALSLARLLGPAFDQPSPAFLLSAALSAEYSHADIEPLYARQSDAEENIGQIASRLGLNPKEAEERLKNLLSAAPKNLE